MGEVAVMNGPTFVRQAYIPLPGGVSMVATGTGGTTQQIIEDKDWLGTARVGSVLGTRAVTYDRAFAPYGETYDNLASTSFPNFTGDRQDLQSGLFDTASRELAPVQGRWLSPDSAGAGWNLYGYAANPLSATDPTGMWNVSYGALHGCAMSWDNCLPSDGVVDWDAHDLFKDAIKLGLEEQDINLTDDQLQTVYDNWRDGHQTILDYAGRAQMERHFADIPTNEYLPSFRRGYKWYEFFLKWYTKTDEYHQLLKEQQEDKWLLDSVTSTISQNPWFMGEWFEIQTLAKKNLLLDAKRQAGKAMGDVPGVPGG